MLKLQYTVRFCLRLSLLSICLWSGRTLQAEEKTQPKQYPVRTWTAVSGNTLSAAFVKEESGKIFLQRSDQSVVAIARDRLSPNDLAWVDAILNPTEQPKTLSFEKATMLETNRMEQYRKIRRIIIRTYADLTNNHRDDKALAFLERDAEEIFGWSFIGAECYPRPDGKRGKVKTMYFRPQGSVPLREAVEMMRDKFTIVMPDPVMIRETKVRNAPAWEVVSPPNYIEKVILLADGPGGNVTRFDLHFPLRP